MSKWNVFVVAGEASADLHAALLLKELKASGAELKTFGVGGPALAQEGMKIELDAAELSIMGFTGWMDKVGGAYRGYKRLCRLVREQRPDAAILLDLPDFNLMMARQLKRAGIPVIYYISPQVWAWRKYRIKKIKRFVDRMLVLFPFEKEFYDRHGVKSAFVGHPLTDHVVPRTEYRDAESIEAAPRIALLPGSRKSEIRMHGPLLSGVAKALKIAYPEAQFRVPMASTLSADQFKGVFPDGVELIAGATYDVLRWADVALVASGTATLETALIGTPFCLFYKASGLNRFLFRYFARYKNFAGMPNLLVGREVAKELILENAVEKELFEECVRLIEDRPYRQAAIEGMRECRRSLGEGGASGKAAAEVLTFLRQRGGRAEGPHFEPVPVTP